MSSADNKDLYRRYIELLWQPERLDEVLAPDFVAHDLPPGLPPRAASGWATNRRMLR
jgi:hypothetical protein